MGPIPRQVLLAAAVIVFALPAHKTLGPARVDRPRHRAPARSFEALGRYQFPVLRGWHRAEGGDAISTTIAYTRTVAGAQVTVRYTLVATPPGTTPASEARLRRDVATTAATLLQGARAEHARVRHLRTQITRFRGRPAAITLARTSVGADVNDTRMLRFVADGSEYWISVNVRGPTRAWRAFRLATGLWEECRRETRPAPRSVVPR